MNPQLTDLLTAVVAFLGEQGNSVTKTKLLKLLYLFDVEFYRAHGRTFTGFQWKYFHLGPWTREFDPLLERLVAGGAITENLVERTDFDARFLNSTESIDLARATGNFKDEMILKAVLQTWGSSSTGEILDYVYFRTEPMEHGVRNELLDFSTILAHSPELYKRSSSGKAPSEVARLRRVFTEQIKARVGSSTFKFTAPKYDEEFHAAIERLDAGDL